MLKRKCERCGREYEYESHANHIVYCPHCRQYSFLECEYGYGPVVPCFICLGTDVIGTVTYNRRSNSEYRFDSDKYQVHTVLKNRSLKALEEAKDIVTEILSDESIKNKTGVKVKSDKKESKKYEKEKSGKFFGKDLMLICAAFLFVVLGFFIPPSGGSALLDEFCDVLVIAAAGAYVSVKVLEKPKKTKIAVIAICALVCIWFAKDPVIDLVSGTSVDEISSPYVEKYTGHAGIISSKYYLRGVDSEGNSLRIRISRDDYESIQQMGRGDIEAEYYKHSNRLLRYERK